MPAPYKPPMGWHTPHFMASSSWHKVLLSSCQLQCSSRRRRRRTRTRRSCACETWSNSRSNFGQHKSLGGADTIVHDKI
jgi:hypothetical protein